MTGDNFKSQISYDPNESNPYEMKAHTFNYVSLAADDPHVVAEYIVKYAWSGITWAKGHRKEDNFLFSDWCLLDFDSPQTTIEQIKNQYCDMTHIIGTTRKHRTKECPHDRFRLAIPWSKRIENLADYRFNMSRLVSDHESDKKCASGAHAFYKCTEIVSVNVGDYKMDWSPAPEGYSNTLSLTPQQYAERLNLKARRWVSVEKTLPRNIARFLIEGIPFAQGGREISCFTTAIELFEHNFSAEEVLIFLMKAPFDRKKPHAFTDDEIRDKVASAYKFVKRRLMSDDRKK